MNFGTADAKNEMRQMFLSWLQDNIGEIPELMVIPDIFWQGIPKQDNKSKPDPTKPFLVFGIFHDRGETEALGQLYKYLGRIEIDQYSPVNNNLVSPCEKLTDLIMNCFRGRNSPGPADVWFQDITLNELGMTDEGFFLTRISMNFEYSVVT